MDTIRSCLQLRPIFAIHKCHVYAALGSRLRWSGVFISAIIAFPCASAFLRLGCTSYSFSMPVVSGTVASEATRRCDTNKLRTPVWKNAFTSPGKPSALGVPSSLHGIASRKCHPVRIELLLGDIPRGKLAIVLPVPTLGGVNNKPGSLTPLTPP